MAAEVAIALGGFIINVLLLGAVVIQLALLRAQLRQAEEAAARDHERRRRQATLEYYETTLATRADLRRTLPYDSDREAIEAKIEAAKNDEAVSKNISEYLALFESISIAIARDVFDEEVMRDIAGRRLVDIATHYEPWVEYRRQRTGNGNLYAGLERLAMRWGEMRQQLGGEEEE